MKIKIWTSKQFPVICELFLKHLIPLEAAREAIGVIVETERYYGENRSMEQAGGFLILFTECCLLSFYLLYILIICMHCILISPTP